MVEVWFFLAWTDDEGGVTQAGPFVSSEQAELARLQVEKCMETSPSYQGVWK